MTVESFSSLEKQWRAALSSKQIRGRQVLSICGPSGVGKTTVAQALADNYPTLIESTKRNPHLNRVLGNNDEFNAAANQQWFLQRIRKHIARADSTSPLVLDQDPAAVVFAYSRMFLEEGKMNEADYGKLLQRLLQIEEALHAWSCPRTVLFLDAPADVLYRRVLRREGKSRTPSLKWFERVRDHFVQLFTRFPNAFTASTADLSPEQVIARARSLIENRSKFPQA